MDFLQKSNSSYVIISSDKIDDIITILYSKEYQVVPIKGFYKGEYGDSVIAFGRVDNNNLRNDIIHLLNLSNLDHAIVKYLGDTDVRKISKDGSEKNMGVIMYNTDSDNKSYLYNGLSFSFVEKARYWKPSKKEDFRIGMIVEYFDKDKWCERLVENPQDEYDKLYKLLIKYDKVRVASK
jgi:hypothetical protein